MLIGDVKVLTQAILFGDQADEIIGNSVWITVKKTNPVQTVNGRQLPEEPRDSIRQPEVLAKCHRVLGNQDQFANALARQSPGFFNQRGDRTAAKLAAKTWNGAEGADVIATFGDLEIRHVGRSRKDAWDCRDFFGCIKGVDFDVSQLAVTRADTYGFEDAPEF